MDKEGAGKPANATSGGLMSGKAAHFHYEVWGGNKTAAPDGWVYSTCGGCGYRWRTKTITEPVTDKPTTN